MIAAPPSIHFFTCGASEGSSRPNALDGALLSAGLGEVSLVKIHAALPAGCRLVEPHLFPPGALVPAACAAVTSEMPGEIISAGVAAAYPVDRDRPALVVEYASRGHKEDIEAIARRMAGEGLRVRGLEVGEIRSIAVQHRVEKIGTAFAAVVLGNEEYS